MESFDLLLMMCLVSFSVSCFNFEKQANGHVFLDRSINNKKNININFQNYWSQIITLFAVGVSTLFELRLIPLFVFFLSLPPIPDLDDLRRSPDLSNSSMPIWRRSQLLRFKIVLRRFSFSTAAVAASPPPVSFPWMILVWVKKER